MTSERPRASLLIGLLMLTGSAGCARFERGQPSESVGRGDAGISADGGGAAVGDGLSFAEHVHPILMDTCGRCHGPGGAQQEAFELTGDPERDHGTVLGLSNADDPESSRLLRRASGNSHARVIAAGSPDYMTIAAWMAGGERP